MTSGGARGAVRSHVSRDDKENPGVLGFRFQCLGILGFRVSGFRVLGFRV